jgi:hypothetical protein
MRCRPALLTLIAAVSACNPSPPGKAPAQPAAQEKEALPALSAQQLRERSEQCEKTAREQFQRDWKNGVVPAADGLLTADFSSHYNAKLNTCFYLLTVSHSAYANLKIMLFDISDGEQYGEYSGPADGLPKTCRIEAIYCASQREWDVLARAYMED